MIFTLKLSSLPHGDSGQNVPKCSCKWLEHEIQNAPLLIRLRVLRQQGPLNLINNKVCDTFGPGHRREHVSTLCLAEYGSSYGWQWFQASATDTLARGLRFMDIRWHINGLRSHWRDKSLHPNLFSSKAVDGIIEATLALRFNITKMQPLPSQMSASLFNREISVYRKMLLFATLLCKTFTSPVNKKFPVNENAATPTPNAPFSV